MTRSSGVNERVSSLWLALFVWIILSTSVASPMSLTTLFVAMVAPQTETLNGPAVGHTAPKLALSDFSGRTVTLAAYQGRPVILNFWATWCVPCRQEMPLLQQASETHQHMGLTILGINQDEPERYQAVEAYWVQAGLTFANLFDPDGTTARRYQVFILPSTMFVNTQGRVTAIHRGPLNATQLERYLGKLMVP